MEQDTSSTSFGAAGSFCTFEDANPTICRLVQTTDASMKAGAHQVRRARDPRHQDHGRAFLPSETMLHFSSYPHTTHPLYNLLDIAASQDCCEHLAARTFTDAGSYNVYALSKT